MQKCNLTALLNLFAVLLGTLAQAQDPLGGAMTMGFGDVAAIKQKAEAGDARAQVALGEALAAHFRATEALQWHKKAAVQGNIEAECHIGEMLLFGAPGSPSNLTVPPNQTEGIRWTFRAATNLHPRACRNMAKASRQGLGTTVNLVEAYAWLELFSETSAGSIVGRVEMNELALTMDTSALRQAQNLAAQFKAGNWQRPVARAIPEGDPRLKVNSINFGGKVPLAMINGKTLAEGESAKIFIKPFILKIKCLKIEKDAVRIAVEGEDSPRLLRPANRK
jgi:hypothetical protein